MPKTDAWMIVFEDADRRPQTFTGEGAEVAAHTTYARLNGNWNMHLFQTIELDPTLVNHMLGRDPLGDENQF
jgi:hypothetical protein